MTTTHEVVAKRWQRGWELHVQNVGVTQARSLTEAEEMAVDYIATKLDVPADGVAVRIRPDVGDELAYEVEAARRATDRADEAQREAARLSRSAVRHLKDAGLTQQDIAVYLGVSAQRVSQLAKS